MNTDLRQMFHFREVELTTHTVSIHFHTARKERKEKFEENNNNNVEVKILDINLRNAISTSTGKEGFCWMAC